MKWRGNEADITFDKGEFWKKKEKIFEEGFGEGGRKRGRQSAGGSRLVPSVSHDRRHP